MGLVLSAILAACVVAAGLVLRRALLRHLLGAGDADAARQSFRFEREWLEARFLGALEKIDPIERLRWDDAQWQDEVVWARDRHNGRLLALVGVDFEPEYLPDVHGEAPARRATALFEYRKGRWNADGKRLDEICPDEAFLRHQRFEPVVFLHPRRV